MWTLGRYILVVFLPATMYTCDHDVIDACFSHNPQHLAGNTSGIFPYYGDAALQRLCSNHTESLSCLEPHLKQCPLSERRRMESKNAALTFLCSPQEQKVYQKARACVSTVAADHCNHTYIAQLSRLQSEHDTFHNNRVKLCRYMVGMADCLRGTVQQQCGQEASEWLHEMKMHLLSPTLHELGCVQSHVLGATAILAIAVALLLAAVCIALIGVVFRRRARRHLKASSTSHRPRPAAASAPPPRPPPQSHTTRPGGGRERELTSAVKDSATVLSMEPASTACAEDGTGGDGGKKAHTATHSHQISENQLDMKIPSSDGNQSCTDDTRGVEKQGNSITCDTNELPELSEPHHGLASDSYTQDTQDTARGAHTDLMHTDKADATDEHTPMLTPV